MVRGIEDCDNEGIYIIMSFVGFHIYLSVASVSTRWRHTWGQRPRVTSLKWAIQSCSCLDWAKTCGLDISSRPCLLAAAEGRLDVLQHAVALGYSREGMAIYERAAAGGHLEVVKWCRANGYPWGLSKLLAAEGGHLGVLQWCIASNTPKGARKSLVEGRYQGPVSPVPGKSETAVLNAAVKGGQLETVEWCWQQGYQWGGETSFLAVKGGHLNLLKWLRDKGCPWSTPVIIGALNLGDLEMLEWCRANGCPWIQGVHLWAIGRCNLKIVKWSVASDSVDHIHESRCSLAAAGGHLEVVQWLRGMGCPWGNGVCFLAASRGHFEVLKWCIANGCPWDNVTDHGYGSESHGTVPMMLWAAENGCPWMADPHFAETLCWQAAKAGNLEVLKWCAMNHSIPRSMTPDKFMDGYSGSVYLRELFQANPGALRSFIDRNFSLCANAADSESLAAVK